MALKNIFLLTEEIATNRLEVSANKRLAEGCFLQGSITHSLNERGGKMLIQVMAK